MEFSLEPALTAGHVNSLNLPIIFDRRTIFGCE